MRYSRRDSVIDKPAAAMCASPDTSMGKISETLSTDWMKRSTPSSLANARTRSYSGPDGPLGPKVYDVGLSRVTTRSSPVSRTCSRIDGGDEHVPINPASVIMNNKRTLQRLPQTIREVSDLEELLWPPLHPVDRNSKTLVNSKTWVDQRGRSWRLTFI